MKRAREAAQREVAKMQSALDESKALRMQDRREAGTAQTLLVSGVAGAEAEAEAREEAFAAELAAQQQRFDAALEAQKGRYEAQIATLREEAALLTQHKDESHSLRAELELAEARAVATAERHREELAEARRATELAEQRRTRAQRDRTPDGGGGGGLEVVGLRLVPA